MAAFGQGGRSFYRPNFFGGFSFFPPVIKMLLISNVAVWLLLDVVLAPFTVSGLPIFVAFRDYLALWPFGMGFWPWQLLTYMFMHGGFWHLFFNMFALWMFGMELENTWGSRKFLVYYLLCGLGAGLTNLLIAPLVGQNAPTVGASGAVFGVLIAFGMLFPDRPIYLYFLLPVRAKYFIAIYIGLELFTGVTGTSDGVAHFAHLGGAAVGFLYLLIDTNLLPVRRWLRVFLPRTKEEKPWEATPWSTTTETREAKFYDIRSGKEVPKEDQEITQEVIDAILDKISKGGYQSLTEEEKRKLFEASKKMN
jgi:membrane associated rhomboid family serine protease